MILFLKVKMVLKILCTLNNIMFVNLFTDKVFPSLYCDYSHSSYRCPH